MEPVQLLTGLLTKTLGLPNEEIAAKLYKMGEDGTLTDEISETAGNEFENLFVQKLQGIQGELSKAERDAVHQQAKFEALSKEEEKIRKKYGIESNAKLDKLIDEVVARASKKDVNIDDQILVHPSFVGLKEQMETEIAALKEAHAAEINATKKQVERRMRFNDNMPLIDAALESIGVNAAQLKPNSKRAFYAQFENYDFLKNETGTYLTDLEGKIIKDALSNPVKLEAFVAKDAPNWFEIAVQPARQAPGNDPAQPTAPQPGKKWRKEDLPKSQEEFNAVYYKLPFADREAFVAAYQESMTG